MGYFRFFLHTPDFLPPCTLPYAWKKSFKLLFLKSQKISRWVSKMRVLAPNAPPPDAPSSLFRVLRGFNVVPKVRIRSQGLKRHIHPSFLIKFFPLWFNSKLWTVPIQSFASYTFQVLHDTSQGLNHTS